MKGSSAGLIRDLVLLAAVSVPINPFPTVCGSEFLTIVCWIGTLGAPASEQHLPVHMLILVRGVSGIIKLVVSEDSSGLLQGVLWLCKRKTRKKSAEVGAAANDRSKAGTKSRPVDTGSFLGHQKTIQITYLLFGCFLKPFFCSVNLVIHEIPLATIIQGIILVTKTQGPWREISHSRVSSGTIFTRI